jgi:hypothetical protein
MGQLNVQNTSPLLTPYRHHRIQLSRTYRRNDAGQNTHQQTNYNGSNQHEQRYIYRKVERPGGDRC